MTDISKCDGCGCPSDVQSRCRRFVEPVGIRQSWIEPFVNWIGDECPNYLPTFEEMKEESMRLNDGDRIVVAWSENVNGPGWSNQIIRVLIRSRGGDLREDSIQPTERTEAMAILHDVSAVVSMEMTAWVKSWADEASR